MDNTQETETTRLPEEVLEFFKALADANRLKIIGLLAQQPYAGEQLAALLGLSVSTVSHHLQMLAHAGLVTAHAESYYSVYSLQTEVLAKMAQRAFSKESLPKLAGDVDRSAFDRKVLAAFTTPDGRFKKHFPAQQKKFLVLLRHALEAFEPGRRYGEKEVNEMLGRFHEDTARLRRGMIEFHFMAREGGGGAYWRIDDAGSAEHAEEARPREW